MPERATMKSHSRNSSATQPLLPNQQLKPNTMLKKFSFFGIFLVCSVFLLILLVSHRLVSSTSFEFPHYSSIGRTIQSWSSGEKFEKFLNIEKSDNNNNNILFVNKSGLSIQDEITNALIEQREKIKKEMIGYKNPDGKYNFSANDLSELVPELGGQPIRNVIITSWRSGSTFVGGILNSHPANYYHYEPLLDFDIVQIRGPPNASNAINVLRKLLNCNYTGLDNYLNYGKKHDWLFRHNKRLWESCERHPSLCWMPEFLNPFCKIFPFQSMKIVRLRLRLMEELLNDQRLNLKVLLLVRDPRGTLQSRKHRDWCPGNPDCDQPDLLCADLVSDYSAALRLSEKFPTRFLAMRYEDLSLEPYKAAKEMFRFYGLYFHPNVTQFLDTHTKVDVGGVSSTYRNSKSAPFHWRQDLTFQEVTLIQSKCGPAMKYWGYVKAHNATHQRTFNPIVDFKLT